MGGGGGGGGGMVFYKGNCMRVISCHYSVYQKRFNIKLPLVVSGMMDVFHYYYYLKTANCPYYNHKQLKFTRSENSLSVDLEVKRVGRVLCI